MSGKSRNKTLKWINRPCPDCYGKLIKILHDKEINGVIFSETYIECQECGYSEKFDVSKKGCKEELIFKGKENAPKKNNNFKFKKAY